MSSFSRRVAALAAAPSVAFAVAVALAAALAILVPATAGADPRCEVEAVIGKNLRAAITADRTA